MIQTRLWKTVILVVLVFLISCAHTDTTGPDLSEGVTGEGYYENNFFNFAINYPPDWSLASRETNQRLREIGISFAKEENVGTATQRAQASKHTHLLLTLTEYPVGKPVPSNPVLQVIAEDVSWAPGIENGKDYLQVFKMQFENMPQLKKTLEDIERVLVNNIEFHAITVQFEIQHKDVIQRYWSTKKDGFMLTFFATTTSGEDLSKIEEVLETVHYKP